MRHRLEAFKIFPPSAQHPNGSAFQCGVIECVPDAKSRDQIGRKINTDLFVYFKKEYGEESSQERTRVRIALSLNYLVSF